MQVVSVAEKKNAEMLRIKLISLGFSEKLFPIIEFGDSGILVIKIKFFIWLSIHNNGTIGMIRITVKRGWRRALRKRIIWKKKKRK